jgi:glucose 1-dehydrogenase
LQNGPHLNEEAVMDIRLDNQVAIITGASSGIGYAVAETFAANGAAVTINYHSHGEVADALVEKIRQQGGRAIAVEADVSDPAQVETIFAKTLEAFGAVDIVVANSGLQKDATVDEMTFDDWRKVLDVNLTGQFLCAQAGIRQFRKQGRRNGSRALGKILCMSSVHDAIPWAGHVNYAASKGGVAMMMKTLAQEVASSGIRVNAISPGAIRTPINRDATEGDAEKELLKLIPYGRVGETDDVANAALWLVSDAADYVVGATLYIDGGMMLYPGFRDNG